MSNHSDAILRYFEYTHLPKDLADVGKEFHALAHSISRNLPDCLERSISLRKLLEAKDCAIRSVLY